VQRLVNAEPTLPHGQGMKIQTWQECNRDLSPNPTGCKISRKMQIGPEVTEVDFPISHRLQSQQTLE